MRVAGEETLGLPGLADSETASGCCAVATSATPRTNTPPKHVLRPAVIDGSRATLVKVKLFQGVEFFSDCEGAAGSASSRLPFCQSWLLGQVQGWPADTFSFELEIYLDMVGNLDERNAFVHSVVLTIEDHFPFNLA